MPVFVRACGHRLEMSLSHQHSNRNHKSCYIEQCTIVHMCLGLSSHAFSQSLSSPMYFAVSQHALDPSNRVLYFCNFALDRKDSLKTWCHITFEPQINV